MHQLLVKQSDNELITSYRKGSDKAFEILMNRHKDRIYTTIILITKDSYIAEDILQETFVKVVNTLRSEKYDEKGAFMHWVKRIAFNLAIDHFRKQKRRPVIVTGEGNDVINNMKFSEDSIESIQVKNDLRRQIHMYIRELPESQRKVLIMRQFMKMSFKDIASELDISINTALGRMRYALINLRKKINKKSL